MMRTLRIWLVLLSAVLASGCGYNRIQQQDEAVKAAWSEVVNQYQRRADLVPNLVNTVKGYAAQEQKVLIGVTEDVNAGVVTRSAILTMGDDMAIVKTGQAFSRFIVRSIGALSVELVDFTSPNRPVSTITIR